MNNLPTWVKVIFNFGLPTAIVFFLLAQGAGYVPSVASETREAVKSHSEATGTLDRAQLEALQAIARGQQESARLLRIQCLKQATTDSDRQQCL